MLQMIAISIVTSLLVYCLSICVMAGLIVILNARKIPIPRILKPFERALNTNPITHN